jgi:hypothetical protein
LLDLLVDVPAYVVDAAYNVVAWNPLARHFVGDLSAVGEPDRNMVRWTFTRGDDHLYWSEEQNTRFARALVADLRAAYARYPGNRQIETLVSELRGVSARFARMWDEHQVAVRRTITKRVVHPEVGPLEFECQVLYVDDTDQRVIVYVPEPDSPTAAAFRRLAALAPPALTRS